MAKDYTTITDEEVTAELIAEHKAKKLQEVEDTKKEAFNEAKNAAFAALAVEQDEAKQALGQVWQTAEDNDYTIPE